MEHLPALLFHMPWMSQHRFSTAISCVLVACQQSQLTLVPGRAQPTPERPQGGHPPTVSRVSTPGASGGNRLAVGFTAFMCSWGSVVCRGGQHDGRCSGNT